MEMSEFSEFFYQDRSVTHKQRMDIEEILSEGPSTVSTIAEKLELPTDIVVWNLMGLLRWGVIETTGEENHELVYAKREV
jgi:predicted transcriptional regulator